MLGAIAGDVVGSAHEWKPVKNVDFPLFAPSSRFTDDTVLTIACAEALLTGGDFAVAYRRWYRRYPDAGFGGMFSRWARNAEMGPYNSYGNGSAMRVSPVAWAFEGLEAVRRGAAASASVTHDHPEGIKGAQATACAAFLARKGGGKEAIQEYVEREFGYDLSTPLDEIRPAYHFDVTCQGSVPQALRAFVEGRDFEEVVRLAVSLGGDADTQACIAGGVAEAFFGPLPERIAAEVRSRLDPPLLEVVERFQERYGPRLTS